MTQTTKIKKSVLKRKLAELNELQKRGTLEEGTAIAREISDIRAELRKRDIPRDPRILAGRQNRIVDSEKRG
jgi:cytochrome c-type biogenesis protein CcmH/NrfG